jgi:molybdopterin molybdotransferase
MAPKIKTDQYIARLTPLEDVLALIDSHVKPVAPRERDIAAALGLKLADDVHVAQPLPERTIALRDGYAVDADATRDASSYAPVQMPAPPFVNTGDALPAGTDAVLPKDVVMSQGTMATILSPATIGEGVLPAGADAEPKAALFQRGHVLRASDLAVLRAAGMSSVPVRAPRIGILRSRRENDRILDAAATWMKHAVTAAGGEVVVCEADDLPAALRALGGLQNLDGAIGIGGTGTGTSDHSIATLTAACDVAFHGIAISPGETSALGLFHGKPVLLSPGRLDAALATWMFIGERTLERLCAQPRHEAQRTVRLTRKVSSTLGITELIPVICKDDEAEPLGANYLSLQILARANGWISVPPQSEGFPAGASVAVRALP